jgi:YfiH family protein
MGVKHGVFTRKGGVSPGPWATLNLGGTVGDPRENVIENRRRIFEIFERPVESVFDVWQVHSAEVVCAESPRPLDQPHQKGDAILTNRAEITLLMRFADCVPIFLYDPKQKVVGIVHAGWKGTVNRTAAAAVLRMHSRYGTAPEDVIACIGPSIGPDHYQVGEEVVAEVQQAFSKKASLMLHAGNRKIHFDLWAANVWQLEEVGVKSIETAAICTACDLERWYSHRAEHGKTGRFGALISL